jgi:hypothetical protein
MYKSRIKLGLHSRHELTGAVRGRTYVKISSQALQQQRGDKLIALCRADRCHVTQASMSPLQRWCESSSCSQRHSCEPAVPARCAQPPQARCHPCPHWRRWPASADGLSRRCAAAASPCTCPACPTLLAPEWTGSHKKLHCSFRTARFNVV